MTAAGRLRSALRDEIHGVTAQSDEQNLEIIRISRLSLPPTNTCGRKAGLGYTLEGRDPFLPWAPAFAGVTDFGGSIGPL